MKQPAELCRARIKRWTRFRSNDLPTGILTKTERPEYGAAYRKAAVAQRASKTATSANKGKA